MDEDEMTNYETMRIMLNRLFFSKNTAEKIIGSRKKMNDLIDKGMIRVKRKNERGNAKYFLNALDVMKHASL